MKKPICIAIAFMIFIIPTIAAVFFYFIPDISERSTENETAGVLTLSNGESYSFDEENNVFLTEFFKNLKNNSQDTSKAFITLPSNDKASVKISINGEKKDISLFFDLNEDCFWADEDQNVYKMDQEYADTFINSQYAESFYEFSAIPTLRIASGQSIIPSYTQWKYTLKNGSLTDGSKTVTTSDINTYYSTSTTDFYFSTPPDVCTVKVYTGNTKKYEGTLDGLSNTEFEDESLVSYEIEAKWENNADSTYFGEAKYSFSIKQTKAPTFSVDKTTLMQGEFLTISVQNISDLSNLSCSFFFPINFTPVFHKNGNDAYALVPFSIDLEPDTYILILRYENTQETFIIELTEHEPKIQEDPDLSLDDKALEGTKNLISSVGQAPSDTVYASGTFYNYENDFDDEYYIRLGFGHIRQFDSDKSLRLNGVDFYRPTGENIPALNSGIVCKVGEDPILGKYVVVDHGYGVKSWYCHVGEITVTQGKSIIKGDTVARTGASGLTSSPGFYLITTIYEVPVSPYNFYENNFVFPN